MARQRGQERRTGDDLGACRGESGQRQPPEWLLFSLAVGSPSLSTLPGTGSPADIYADLNPSLPGGEVLYVSPLTLGLEPADDLDALIVFDDGDHEFHDGFDQVVFSLAPGSPSLGGVYGPGDLFTSEGFGYFALYCAGAELGLELTDNLNMLDYVLCDHALTCAYDWAIGYVGTCVEDINGDGEVNLADLSILLASYGQCECSPDYWPGADMDDDGCVGASDLATLLAAYGTSCGP